MEFIQCGIEHTEENPEEKVFVFNHGDIRIPEKNKSKPWRRQIKEKVNHFVEILYRNFKAVLFLAGQKEKKSQIQSERDDK